MDEVRVRAEHDRGVLAGLLGRDPLLHAYELGDLDDAFWPYTRWWRRGEQVALLYQGVGLATLLAFAPPERTGGLVALLAELVPVLPDRLHAHLSPGVADAVAGGFEVTEVTGHLKLALTDRGRLAGVVPAGSVLTGADLPELAALYAVAYPEVRFDERLLATGRYVGIRDGGELVAVAGVHVWSPVYGVAAVGNVATHPRVRGRGLAGAAVAAVCGGLLRDGVDRVVLNVRADNGAAVRLYERLGFTRVAGYDEMTVTVRR
ncbi:GNAT family N-acetyltransferase [Micromonospora cathayae]|uniref:GNAT family N-acetyltransferase n=1 Tax=Micromonospora cathayae TaxID=3028804 RepID=A0ABY7ZL24_9ACTN|nr:GNAT family N-acetyltransferase [Micromonospora sp. HUAS 3]WDZ83156.1 GNAT family N-acetyltransferase [Micromonospora sp. HUAS 3]